MRRRRSSAVCRLVAGLTMVVVAGRLAEAQANPNKPEGATEFLIPTGACSLGMGQAVAAAAVGSDALWWNPALIAKGPRELTLHLARGSSVIAETDAAGAFVFPVRRLGAFAVSFRYINYGTQGAQLDPNNQAGTLDNTNTLIAATFAPIITDRILGGITYKLLRYQYNCTGSCDTPHNSPQAPAIDLGFAYQVTADSSLWIGGALRNLGPRFQVKDRDQADLIPSRADFGAQYTPHLAQLPSEARLRIAADVVSYVSGGGGPGFRFGGELAWQDRYQARAGYVVSGPTGSGPSLGLGVRSGKLQIDFAQFLSDDAAQAGVTPTFLTLRYIF